MQSHEPPHAHDEEDGGDEGESGKGDFGRPELKPNLETLFDAVNANADAQVVTDNTSSTGGIGLFGAWELHESSLMLFHRQLKKRLMLAQLDSASKMMKVIVALSTQPASVAWDIEHLIKAMDHASQKKFGKGLYHIAGMVSDSARLDWEKGTLTSIELPKSHTKGL
jgi:hypothetical protein